MSKFCVDCKWYRPERHVRMSSSILTIKEACLSPHQISLVTGRPTEKMPVFERFHTGVPTDNQCGPEAKHFGAKESQQMRQDPNKLGNRRPENLAAVVLLLTAILFVLCCFIYAGVI